MAKARANLFTRNTVKAMPKYMYSQWCSKGWPPPAIAATTNKYVYGHYTLCHYSVECTAI